MSHFSRVQTELFDQKKICQALEDLALPYEVGKALSIRGWLDHSAVAQIRVQLPQTTHQVGFTRQDEVQAYTCIADWWNTGYTEQRFLGQVSQRYAYHTTMETLTRQGFSLIEEEQEGEQIHLRLRRMG